MRDHLEVREGKPAGLWSDRLRIAHLPVSCVWPIRWPWTYTSTFPKRCASSPPSAWSSLSARCPGKPAKIPERVGVRVNGQQKSLESLRFQGFYWQGRTLWMPRCLGSCLNGAPPKPSEAVLVGKGAAAE